MKIGSAKAVIFLSA